jgi:hypothetical protein
MKQLITQYGGLKKEIYILFIGKLVTAMGSFVWPMLTFLMTTKLGLSDGTSTLLIATASVLSFQPFYYIGLSVNMQDVSVPLPRPFRQIDETDCFKFQFIAHL